MKEIVSRLHENRQVELAKSILEGAGYKVTKGKKLKESNSGSIYDYVEGTEPIDAETIEMYMEEDIVEFIKKSLGVSVDKCYYICSDDDEQTASELGSLGSKVVDKLAYAHDGVDILVSPAGEKYAKEWGDGVDNYYIPMNPVRESRKVRGRRVK